tara:strand:- start:263 stop:763 length:501 start_codon:yes stop_codon:yes gene_type:complete
MFSTIVKATLAAIMVSEANASRSAASLIAEAQAMVGSEAGAHLSAAIAAMKTDAEILESHSQIVNVPIDEKRALTLKVSPTYTLDEVNSVTLKSFRKIVGYDTFDSIRRKDRNETKDTSDYYNVTVSMMIRRRPAEAAAAPARDPYAPDGAPSLAATLDKGFPYDD